VCFIVSNIKSVNHCILSIDQYRTVCKTIKKIALDFGDAYDLSFANGGIEITTPFQKDQSVIKWELT